MRSIDWGWWTIIGLHHDKHTEAGINSRGMNKELQCFLDMYWLSPSESVLTADRRHTCTSFMLEDAFYLWLWIKLKALKRLKDDQLTSENEPYELWKQPWCFLLFYDYLWSELLLYEGKREAELIPSGFPCSSRLGFIWRAAVAQACWYILKGRNVGSVVSGTRRMPQMTNTNLSDTFQSRF